MIDHLDKQTQTLTLEPKRGRGRPATGQALSNAERQRRYREAQKAQRNDNNAESAEYWERMHSQCMTELALTREALDEICGRLIAAESRLAELSGKNSEAPRYWCMRTRKQGSTKWKKLNAPWYNIEHAKEAVRQLNANSDGWEWELYAVRNDA